MESKHIQIIFLRHGHSQANEKNILAGRIEPVHLSKKGIDQSLQLQEDLAAFKPDKIYSSPLIRCQETVKTALPNSHKTIILDERIMEMDYGKWSGRSLKGLSKEPLWKKIMKDPAAVTFPGGESFLNLQFRIDQFLTHIMSRSVAGEKILVISHGDVIRIAINKILDRSFNDFQKLRIVPASRSSFFFQKEKKEYQLAVIDYLNKEVDKVSMKKSNKFQLGGEVE